MAIIKDHVDVQAVLLTANVPRASFGIGLFLVDDPQIPPDSRFRYTTESSFASDFDDESVPGEYALVYFSQKRIAEKLMIGRWISAATPPFFVCGPGYSKDVEALKLITAGEFRIVDSEANEFDLTALDFSAITAWDQIIDVLNDAIALIDPKVCPIIGLESSKFRVDSTGRLVLEMATTGSAAPLITITTTEGVDDISESVFDASNGKTRAGLDVEEPVDAIQAIREIDGSFYNIHERGASDDQKVAVASYVESQDLLFDLVGSDAAAKDPADSTDVGSRLKALSTKRTLGIYTEHPDQYPDAAVGGCVLPAQEGTTSFAYEVLALVTDSGLDKPLTKSERIALKAKGWNWIETVGETYLYDGITFGNEEKRIMLGRDWFVARIMEDIFTDQLNTPLNAFDNETLTKVEGYIRTRGEQAITRRILVNTPDRPFTVNLPDADDITQAERQSHKLTQYEVFKGYINSAINDYLIVGTWAI